MWAMMPMFRVRANGVWRGITTYSATLTNRRMDELTDLPAIVGEGLVGFGHTMRVFALLDGAAAQVRRVEQLVRELLLHRLAVAALPRVEDQPANAERQAAVRIDFDRHLVVRAANTA